MTIQRLTYFGMQGSGDWTVPDNRPLDWRQQAFKLFPDSPSPFTFILSKLPTRTVKDPEFKLYEYRLPKQSFIVNGLVAAAATTVVLNNAGTEPVDPAFWLKPGDMLINETTGVEVMRVESVTNATTIEVTREWGGTNPGGTIADTSVLRWAGSAYGEGTAAPSAISRRTTTVTNYTQIHKDSAQLTGTAMATGIRPFANSWAHLKNEALERHMMKLEYALLYGVLDETTVGGAGPDAGQPLRTSSGFRSLITGANPVIDFGGAITMTDFEDSLADAFRYGSKTKLAFMGNTALNILNRLVRENTSFNFQGDVEPNKVYNLNVMKFRCPFGTLNVMAHPLMTESDAWTEEVYIVDMKYVSYVKLAGRDTMWKERKMMNSDELQDNTLGVWQTECALELALPETHRVWQGVSGTA